jgi:hypothetical protein
MNINLTARHSCISQHLNQNLNLNLRLHGNVVLQRFPPKQLPSILSIRDDFKGVSHQRCQRNRATITRATLTSELPPPEDGFGGGGGGQKEERNPLFTGPNPTIVLAGFYLEELPAIRQLLDAAGGVNITLVPCMPWLLDLPLHRALAEGEPQWDQPMPQTWVQGGGWGRRRVALFNDIT